MWVFYYVQDCRVGGLFGISLDKRQAVITTKAAPVMRRSLYLKVVTVG